MIFYIYNINNNFIFNFIFKMSSTIHNIYTQIINHKKKKNTYFKKEPKKEIDIKIKEHFTSQKNMLKVSIYNPITLDNILDNLEHPFISFS